MGKLQTFGTNLTSGQGAENVAANATGESRVNPDRPANDFRSTTEREVLTRIEAARTRKARIREDRITLSHGAGGKATHTLIEAMFLENFRNPILEAMEDQAELKINGARLAFTTDSFVVSPLFFPGGNIGDLAVNGTVNDLAVGGARALYLSAGFILEEGFPIADLSRIVVSMKSAAQAASVQIVTGDTKVVQKGKGDGCYINTSGVGVMDRPINLSAASATPEAAAISLSTVATPPASRVAHASRIRRRIEPAARVTRSSYLDQSASNGFDLQLATRQHDRDAMSRSARAPSGAVSEPRLRS